MIRPDSFWDMSEAFARIETRGQVCLLLSSEFNGARIYGVSVNYGAVYWDSPESFRNGFHPGLRGVLLSSALGAIEGHMNQERES